MGIKSKQNLGLILLILLIVGVSSTSTLQLELSCKSLRQRLAQEKNALELIQHIQRDIRHWGPESDGASEELEEIKANLHTLSSMLSQTSSPLVNTAVNPLLQLLDERSAPAKNKPQLVLLADVLSAAYQHKVEEDTNFLAMAVRGRNFSIMDTLLGLGIAIGLTFWAKYSFSKPLKELLLQKKLQDERQAKDQLQKAKQEVEEKNQELETLLYSVTHDLRTPVVSISGFASLLQEDYQNKLDEEALTYIQRIKSNTRHMEKLILDLLELTRVGRVPFNPESVQIKELMQEVIIGFQQTLEKKKINLIIQNNLPTIYCDHYKMAQVFSNLISNSIKYIGDNNPNPTIEVGAQPQNNGVTFFVKDNGIGIDPKYKDKIFQVFQRLEVIHTEGTGIGLAIVKKIVEKHEGRVWIDSAPQEGATFYVFIPSRKKSVEKSELATII